MNFKKGETVIYTASDKGCATNLTDGEEYTVTTDTYGQWIPVIGDDSKDCHVNAKCLTVKHASQANPHGQRITTPQGTFKAQYHQDASDLQAVDEEDYEERKANASVISSGHFKRGDRLVYRDGTVTIEHRTVTRCTATCVWFEETYSMPFNPTEFMLE